MNIVLLLKWFGGRVLVSLVGVVFNCVGSMGGVDLLKNRICLFDVGWNVMFRCECSVGLVWWMWLSSVIFLMMLLGWLWFYVCNWYFLELRYFFLLGIVVFLYSLKLL